MADGLLASVEQLLARAVAGAPATGATRARLEQARCPAATSPLRVAIAGKVKAGKSTLLNALVGEEVAPTDAGECTRIVTWYRNAAHLPGAAPRSRAASPSERPYHRTAAPSTSTSGPRRPDDVDHLEVRWPSRPAAQSVTLIDTPGVASLSTDVSARTERVPRRDGEDRSPSADAVVYLLRHLHASDVRLPRGASTTRTWPTARP